MRVGVSLFQHFPNRIGGTGETIQRVLRAFLTLLGDSDELLLLGSPDNLQSLADIDHPRVQREVWPLSERMIRLLRGSDLCLPWGLSRLLSRRINRLQCDVIWCPQQSLFPRGLTAPVVVTVMDLLHEHGHQFVSPLQRWLRRRKERLIVREARHVLAISQATRADWLRWRDPDPERCSVTYLGGRPLTVAAATNPAPTAAPYLLYPAHPYPHKNHARLLAAWDRVRQRAPELPGYLILTGQQDERLQQLLSDTSHSRVIHLGYRTAGELAALYEGCQAVVLPTLFEGFGIPLLEALGYERPVLCSELPVFRELVGDSVTYFDPWDIEKIALGLERALVTPPVPPSAETCQFLRDRFTWNACARETWQRLHDATR